MQISAVNFLNRTNYNNFKKESKNNTEIFATEKIKKTNSNSITSHQKSYLNFGKRKLTDEDIEEIVLAYKNGIDIKTLAKEYNCTITTIRRHLGKMNFYERVILQREEIDEIAELYKEGVGITELAKEYDCSENTIIKYLCEAKNEETDFFETGKLSKIQYEIVELYKENIGIEELAKEYDCSESAIRCILNRAGF